MDHAFRIGYGFDVHRLVAGRSLILGGVAVPSEKGATGHSDADVLLHALMDAMLGAAALGDIGTHFPDTDPAYEGADSGRLLTEVRQKIEDVGFTVANVDVTVVLEGPRLAPFVDEMRSNVAELLHVEADQVSVKATTSEAMGFVGRGEGVAAHAICLLGKR